MDKYKITFETWDKLASAYQDKFMDLDLYDDTYDFFCESVEKSNPKVLEIGCGPGNVTKYILSKRPDFKMLAIDVAQSMVELAQKNNPAADFKVMDCRELDKMTDKFDAIICGFCMPYLSKEDCSKLITDSASLLENGGSIYFSTIEGDYQNSGFESGSTGDQTYVYYYQADFLKRQLIENNFGSIKLFKKSYPKNDGKNQIHLVFVAKKINTLISPQTKLKIKK